MTWKPGDPCRLVDLRRGRVLDGAIEVVRIKDDAATPFAGRDAWIRYPDEEGRGYYVCVGIADHLWFSADEIERRRDVLGL